MNDQRRFIRIFFILTGFGVMSLSAMLSRSALANIRGRDVVHLMGTGMIFDGAIVSLIAYFLGRRSS